MDNDDISLFEGDAPPIAEGPLQQLVAKATELVSTETQISDLESAVKALKLRAHTLKTSVIPDAMAELGLTSFALDDGSSVAIEDFVAGSLPKDPEKRAKALAALEAIDGAGIIKNELSLTFEKSQHNEAMALADDLRKQGYDCVLESSVHPQTYLAFAREALRNGAAVDTAALGLFVGRQTKIKPPTAPRKKKG